MSPLTMQSSKRPLEVIQFVGLPGSGKSTTARAVYWFLHKQGRKPRWLNQDEANSNRVKYLEAVKRAYDDPATTHLLLDKSNMSPMNRLDYTKLGIEPSLTVIFSHPEGIEAYEAICTERFMSRDNGHRFLTPAKLGIVEFSALCEMMLSQFSEPKGPALILDVRLSIHEVVRAVCDRLALGAVDLDEAVTFASSYEKSIGPTRPVFGGIALADTEALLNRIPQQALHEKRLQKSLHIKTRFLGDEMDPVWFMEQLRLEGTATTVRATEIVWDDIAVAAKVEGPFQSCDNNPHVMLALRDQTPPSYYYTLLKSGQYQSIQGVNLPLQGVFFFG